MKSYVISVSLGTGCYRHIRIGAKATLYKLHQAILNAFDFEDDHQHAFFMDNRVWSPGDAYYSSKAEGWERLTKKYTLEKLRLEKGSKFKYVFDFGDEWVFQCKILWELEEKTDIPCIIRSVGESPEQYPEYEDEEDDGLVPVELTRQEIEELYDEIPLSREVIHCIHGYMQAAANLYGLISLDELYTLYNSQNPKVDAQLFLMAVDAINYEPDNDFLVMEKVENTHSTPEESLKDYEIVLGYLLVNDPERSILELDQMQEGKPLKILSKAEFLRFADSTYFPETPQRRAMIRFLRSLASSLPGSAEDYCSCIQSVIVIDALPGEVLNILKDDGLFSHKNWDLEEFMALYQNLNNSTFKHANRGHTQDELFAMSRQGQKLALRNAPVGQMSFFDVGETKQTGTGTPARNAPCPCGSGRKYKNCCGKKQ